MSQKLAYFPQIDTLRFIAVLMVALSHWLPKHWINHLQVGRLGVELFFVISGFLITRILMQMKEQEGTLSQKLKIFFARRVLRIFPIYYVVVLITFLAHDGHFDKAIIWNIFYGSNFYMLKINEFPGIMSHFWSLSVEEHFYLLWPFLILLPKKNKVIYSIIFAISLGIFFRWYFYFQEFPPLYTNIFTLSCFDALAIGGLLGFLHTREDRSLYDKVTQSTLLFLFALAGFSYSLYSLNFHGAENNPWNLVAFRTFSAICFAFLLSYSIKSNSWFLNQKNLIFMGKLSYSMYLLHNFVPGFLMGIPWPVNPYGRIVMEFIFLVGISYLAWRFIEMPFNKMKKKFAYRT